MKKDERANPLRGAALPGELSSVAVRSDDDAVRLVDAAWWARVVQTRTARDDLRPKRVWVLHKRRPRGRYQPQGGGGHRRGDRAHRGRELRKTRLFRSHEQAELAGAIADTRAMFEGKGWG
jgi:hypothetical protein